MSVSIERDAAQIAADVNAAGSPQRAASEQAYLKIPLKFSGTAVPDIRRIVTTWRRAHPDLTEAELTGLAAALWDGPAVSAHLRDLGSGRRPGCRRDGLAGRAFP